jgi:class 3 adenylate cyclase
MKKRSSWDTTAWLFLNIVIARFLANVAAAIFTNDLIGILNATGYLTPAAPPDAAAWKTHPASFAAGLALQCAVFAAPLVWVWPIGRFVDTDDDDLRAAAVGRFAGINRFFAALIGAQSALAAAGIFWSRLHPATGAPSTAALLFVEAFGCWYSIYFTLLILEPLLFNNLARWLYPGHALYERKTGPMFSVRAKLFLLVANLVVIPMILVGASMKLGLTGFSQGMGVAVLTAVIAVGYTEILYRSIALPLAELNEKMALVSAGDFAAKTTVLAGDEIGRVRWHFNEMIDGLAERERLKETFGRFVSIEIAKRLIETDKISLGGENIEATVLFSDIRDFTPLSESMSPQELVTFLNKYFSFVTAPIAEHRGVVNKFIGDAVMAVFAEQFGSRDHAADALAAAVQMRRQLAEFNAGRPGAAPIRCGIGIHTGLLVAGNIGTDKRMEYTVIGDTVNVAARIESKTKDLGVDVLISDGTYSRLDERARASVKTERCEGVRVKGKDAPLVVYKIL